MNLREQLVSRIYRVMEEDGGTYWDEAPIYLKAGDLDTLLRVAESAENLMIALEGEAPYIKHLLSLKEMLGYLEEEL